MIVLSKCMEELAEHKSETPESAVRMCLYAASYMFDQSLHMSKERQTFRCVALTLIGSCKLLIDGNPELGVLLMDGTPALKQLNNLKQLLFDTRIAYEEAAITLNTVEPSPVPKETA